MRLAEPRGATKTSQNPRSGHLGPGAAQGLDVAIAQGGAHAGRANERRVPHNEIGLRPLCPPCAHIAPLRHLRSFVGHGLAGDGVRFERGAIPAGEQLAGLVVRGLLRIPGEHGVAAFDVAVVVHHGFSHALVAPGADLPLQVADPQHELGQGGGAFVDLDAEQLLEGDGFAPQIKRVLRVAQVVELVEYFSPSRRFRCSSVTYKKLALPQAGSSTRVVHS